MTAPAAARHPVSWTTVVRLLLAFSLLLAFTTSGVALMCLQAQHGAVSMAGPAERAEVPVSTGGTISTANVGTAATADVSTMTTADESSGGTPRRACCNPENTPPSATASHRRALPPEEAATAAAAVLPAGQAPSPPVLPDPAPEQRDHLAPSLTALSISRT